MEKVEKYRKLCKYVQNFGMVAIALVCFLFIFIFGFKTNNGNVITYVMGAMLLLFMFLIFTSVPMQNKLVKMVILESLNGLVSDVTFNKKKGYSRESFEKLNIVNCSFSNYSCSDYYSFKYKNMEIESTTVRAYDEIKVNKIKKNGKQSKRTTKQIKNYFFGRIYLIPLESEIKFNVYGKKNPTYSRKKEMANTNYSIECPLKVKKYAENFEVFSNENQKIDDLQLFIDKLYYLKTQAKGPVFAFVRNKTLVLCIDNNHYYKEIEFKDPIDKGLINDYRKDVSMVLSFINSLLKDKENKEI